MRKNGQNEILKMSDNGKYLILKDKEHEGSETESNNGNKVHNIQIFLCLFDIHTVNLKSN